MRPKSGYIKLFKNLFSKKQLIQLLNVRLKELDEATIAKIYTEVTLDEKLDSILNDLIPSSRRRAILAKPDNVKSSILEMKHA